VHNDVLAARRVYGDQTWTLAYARDGAGLRQAAELLLRDRTGIEYEGHRALAFALALEGRTGEALEELNSGWTDEWPTPDAYGIDVARIHVLAGNPGQSLTALALDSRSIERSQVEDVVTLTMICVWCDRRLWRRGLALALANSRGLDRVLVPARILNAWIHGVDGSRAVPQPVAPAP
jgi:hypothetical protein